MTSGGVGWDRYVTFVVVWARSFGFGDSAQEVIKGGLASFEYLRTCSHRERGFSGSFLKRWPCLSLATGV